MYKKTIKRGNKKYTYFYHNYRDKNKVKNVFLGRTLIEAKKNLDKIKFNGKNNFYAQAPMPNRENLLGKGIPFGSIKENSGAILFTIFLVLLGIGLYYSSYTGFAVHILSDVEPPTNVTSSAYPRAVILNENITINVSADDDVAIDTYIVEITLPDDTKTNLTLVDNMTNYTTEMIGRHSITVIVNDTTGNVNDSVFYDFEVDNGIEFNITTNFYLVESDVNFTIYYPDTEDVIYTGETNGSINLTLADYKYDFYFETCNESLKVTFKEINLTTELDYSNNTGYNTSIDFDWLFGHQNYKITYVVNTNYTFSNVTLILNYTASGVSYVNPDNIYVVKCSNWSYINRACDDPSWVLSSLSRDANNNTFTITDTSLSAFSIHEVGQSETFYTPAGGGASEKATIADIDIIQPDSLSMGINEEITSPIIIKNSGDKTLSAISLKVEPNNPLIEASFDKFYINSLEKGAQEKLTLKIKTGLIEQGQYEIKITANVISPTISDSTKLYLELIETHYFEDKKIKGELEFLKKLLQSYQECSQFSKLLDSAEYAYNNADYDSASNFINSFVNGCRNLKTTREVALYKKVSGVWNIIILVLEVVAFIFVFIIFYNYYRKRQIRNKYGGE